MRLAALCGDAADVELLAGSPAVVADLAATACQLLGEETSMIELQGNADADLAEVLILGGKPEEGVEALEQAPDGYERKENLVSAAHTRARLAGVQNAAPP